MTNIQREAERSTSGNVLKWSLECRTKSSMVKVDVSFQMSRFKTFLDVLRSAISRCTISRHFSHFSHISRCTISRHVRSTSRNVLRAVRYSTLLQRQDSKWSREYQTKSSMVMTGFFVYGSFEKRHQLSPSRISFCIPMTISSPFQVESISSRLIFSGTGVLHSNDHFDLKCSSSWERAVPQRRDSKCSWERESGIANGQTSGFFQMNPLKRNLG